MTSYCQKSSRDNEAVSDIWWVRRSAQEDQSHAISSVILWFYQPSYYQLKGTLPACGWLGVITYWLLLFLSISTNCQNMCISDNHLTPVPHHVVHLIRTSHKSTRNQRASQSCSHLWSTTQMVRLRNRQWCGFLTKLASLAIKADRHYGQYVVYYPTINYINPFHFKH